MVPGESDAGPVMVRGGGAGLMVKDRVKLAVFVFVKETGERPLESTIVNVTVKVP